MLSLRFVGPGVSALASIALALTGCGADDTPEGDPVATTGPAPEPTPEPAAPPEPPPALDLDGEARYGAIPIAPGFSPDPREERGTSRGVVEASELSDECTGFITEAPLHRIEARGPFARLHLMALGEAPIGLVLRTEAGQVHCVPVPDGDRPAHLVQHLAPGEHRVWIATARADDPVRYTLGLSEIELVADALTPP